jgi:hypothetical protein
MSTELSGVIACHSISTTRPEATSQKAPTYNTWPEIVDWLTYYTLPTIDVIYRPDLLLSPTDVLNMRLPEDFTLESQWSILSAVIPTLSSLLPT